MPLPGTVCLGHDVVVGVARAVAWGSVSYDKIDAVVGAAVDQVASVSGAGFETCEHAGMQQVGGHIKHKTTPAAATTARCSP